jgi:hypothetical protein
MTLNTYLKDRRARSPEAGQGAGQPDASPAPVQEASPQAPALDLSFMGQDFVKDGQPDLEAFRVHYQDLIAEDARRREAPQAPADGKYDFALPETLDLGDLALPEGMSLQLAADDPALAPVFDELGAFLHKQGLPQDAATGLMSIVAKYEAAKVHKNMLAAKTEFEALGPTAAAREARLNKEARALETRLPADQAKALQAAASSAAGVRALETLVAQNLGPRSATPAPASQQLDGLRGSALLRALATR